MSSTSAAPQQHLTVLLEEAVSALLTKPDGRYLDATFGRGGHSRKILSQLNSQGQLLGLDKDPQAIAVAQHLAQEDSRFSYQQGTFTQAKTVVENLGWQGVDGILLDLGVSSPQLDDPKRGFSFMHDGPLDMRMDTTQGINAAEWLAQASATEISDVLYHFGEERHSRRMAQAVINARQEQPITTTSQLAEIIKAANPSWEKNKHPATRAFQAIRIFINQELDDLDLLLEQALDLLLPGGRLVVISFHSLEDRKVKRFMRKAAKGEQLPRHLPVMQSDLNLSLKLLGKAIKPTAEEIAVNARSRSAIMRVAEKI